MAQSRRFSFSQLPTTLLPSFTGKNSLCYFKTPQLFVSNNGDRSNQWDRYRVLAADLTAGPRNVVKTIKDGISDTNYGGSLSHGNTVAICAESATFVWDGAALARNHKPQWTIPDVSKLLAISSQGWIACMTNQGGESIDIGVFHEDKRAAQSTFTVPSMDLSAKEVGFCDSTSGDASHLVIAKNNDLLDVNILTG